MTNHIAGHILWINKIGHAKPCRHWNAVIIQVNPDNLIRPRHAQTLHNIQANSAQPEHNRGAADFNFGRVDHRANAGGYAATDVANFIERRIFAHLGQCNFRQNRVVGKGRAAHVMQNRRAIQQRKTAGAIRHQASALRAAD